MRKLKTFSHAQGPQAGMIKGLLEANGIACFIKNERLFTAMGEIPFVECFPELWLLNDEDEPRALDLLKNLAEPAATPFEPWTCPGCGEIIEGQFTRCWKCGSAPNPSEG